MLTEEEKERYSRQILLREIGAQGQEKLKRAKALVIGAGGLGSPAAMYLAAAGVGALGICDGDRVDRSNLQRQILHGTGRIGKKKTASAQETLAAVNPNVQVVVHDCFAGPENIARIIESYEFVLDCTDSFEAKFLINDACVRAGKPFCHAGIFQLHGQLMTWLPGRGLPCYRCVFRDAPPPTPAADKGVLGAAVGVIGCLQAMEAIKYITGAGRLTTGALLTFNAIQGDFRQIALPEAARDCPVCSVEN
ncbi:MAG: HesA/MoeB/ThiF family protein [Oscillospiraceae bacterium]|jgi:molybdopterin/thiamine biosynthesis adenylyltransferase|nr:HesA/MoeB/ThiF family protein [Oscillospiraceae bacterium]